jgi:hypothetical protein
MAGGQQVGKVDDVGLPFRDHDRPCSGAVFPSEKALLHEEHLVVQGVASVVLDAVPTATPSRGLRFP